MAEDTRQTKLDLTISSVAPARLEATRQEVEVERQKLSSSDPPKPESDELPPESDSVRRMKQLDLIQDVQLILVEKYRDGIKLMMGVAGVTVLLFIGLAVLLFKNFELHGRIAALQVEQQKLIEKGQQIEQKTDETKQKVDETKQQVDETKAKVDQAVEASPKIEIDEQGKAKVVLPVRSADPHPKHTSPVPTTSASASIGHKPPAPPMGSAVAPPAMNNNVPLQIPVEAHKL